MASSADIDRVVKKLRQLLGDDTSIVQRGRYLEVKAQGRTARVVSQPRTTRYYVMTRDR